MQNKVGIITGATSGIGKVTAIGLAKMGANVVIIGRNNLQGNMHKTKSRTRAVI